ncbi:MAG: undecaprenyl-phosphate glucose phosphotransferase [Nitrospinota bacterium]|nr:undecaprenyl-phosphate glucose phosphotransferase [Nitrospinota bacterium]MDH5677295.1 undecaprenyl-phosphate glucose phosphotransferase [Nitrospinota bacterium]MDH5756380.1 undecaprenyl-phosphate glucose phosphotransferase [Nitrospinota bacterium]
MLKKHNQLFLTIMLVVDISVVVISWLGAYWLRFETDLPTPKGVPAFTEYLWFIPVLVVIWGLCMHVGGMYSPMRSDSRFNEYFRIFKASAYAITMTMAAAFFYREYSYSRAVMFMFWMLSLSGLIISHIVVRTTLRIFRRKGYNLRYVVIVGAGELAQSLAETFSRHPESGMVLIGMLADNPKDLGMVYHGHKVIGLVDQVNEVIEKHKVDQVFIALPHGAYERLENTLTQLSDVTVDIKLAPDISQFIRLNSSVEDFDGFPIVSLSESPMYGWNKVLKTAFDYIFAAVFIVLWSPVMALIAVAIKLESEGPLLYIQERMSLGGEPFTIYKFRTMKVDAEKETGAVWANPGDDRRTWFGAFLRRTSLDELPQLFNVLTGKMSLVGPRPERPVFVKDFKKSIPKYMLRHKMKAGITGWAQVNGLRGNTSLEKRVEYDLYYIENWSVLFDIKILWLTIWKGFINKHAY